MRFFVSLLLLAGCASSPPPPPPAPPGPPPTLVGTMGGQAFVARSALMTTVNFQSSNNSWDRLMTLSHIRIYDTVVSCPADENPRGEFDPPHTQDRRTIHLLLEGRWPIPPSRLVYQMDPDMTVAADRLLSADFERGYVMQATSGSVAILASNPEYGLLDLDLSAGPGQTDLYGAVSGRIAFAVCR